MPEDEIEDDRRVVLPARDNEARVKALGAAPATPPFLSDPGPFAQRVSVVPASFEELRSAWAAPTDDRD